MAERAELQTGYGPDYVLTRRDKTFICSLVPILAFAGFCWGNGILLAFGMPPNWVAGVLGGLTLAVCGTYAIYIKHKSKFQFPPMLGSLLHVATLAILLPFTIAGGLFVWEGTLIWSKILFATATAIFAEIVRSPALRLAAALLGLSPGANAS